MANVRILKRRSSAGGRPRLAPHHVKALKDRGISRALRARYRTAWDSEDAAAVPGFENADNVTRLVNPKNPALVIPIEDLDGQVVIYVLRLDRPRRARRGEGWRIVKYEWAPGQRITMDFGGDPTVFDSQEPLWITEGRMKADALRSVGVAAIGLQGVWGWQRKIRVSGRYLGHREWMRLELGERVVFICFDSDLEFNEQVAQAAYELFAFLESRGARPRIVLPPEIDGAAKTGVDDFLGAGGTIEEVIANEHTDFGPIRFFVGKSFVPARLGAHVRSILNIERDRRGVLHAYENGAYRAAESQITELVRDALGERWRKDHPKSVLTWLEAGRARLKFAPDRSRIFVSNGVLEWSRSRGPRLISAQPSDLAMYQLPVRWDPDAACPAIERFLADVLHDDLIDFVLEALALCLLGTNELEKAFLLLGYGRNGKGTLLGILNALLGDDLVAHVPPQGFADRFRPSELYGKLANIGGDIDRRSLPATDQFKAVTGRDRVTVEEKYGRPYTFVPVAVHYYAANQMPGATDASRGYIDRWEVIPFDKAYFGEGKADPTLKSKLLEPSELEGFLVLLVNALRRFEKRGRRLERPTSVANSLTDFEEQINPVKAFFDAKLIIDEKGAVGRTDLHQNFREWIISDPRYREGRVHGVGELEAAVIAEGRVQGALVTTGKSGNNRVLRGVSLARRRRSRSRRSSPRP